MIEYCCHRLRHIAETGHFPLRYEPVTGEWRLVQGEGTKEAVCVLRYCPFCGLHFPDPSRPGLKRFRADPEAQRLCELAAPITSTEAMYARLGEPDHVVSLPYAQRPLMDPWVRIYEYRSLSATWRLTVKEYADGSLSKAYSPKPAEETAEL